MPWVHEEMCVGCGVCLEECPAGAISMNADEIAVIDDNVCIRCGICHGVCPEEAVRHDGERVPQEVEANLEWVGRFLTHPYYADDPQKQRELLERLKRYFGKERKVIEKTVERLEALTD